MVGEWSMSTGAVVQVGQAFVDACVRSFQHGVGYYLWTWKVERGWGYDDWDLQFQSESRSRAHATGTGAAALGLALHADRVLLRP